jgi:hypothetical protein
VEWIALAVSAALVIALIVVSRQAASAARDVEFVRRRTTDRIYELSAMVNQLDADVRRLKLQAKLGGDIRFTKDLRIDELMDVHEAAPEVLAGFHIGGCASCSVEPDMTLEQAAQARGANLSAVLHSLNGLLDGQRTLPASSASGLLQIQNARN